MLVRLSDPKTGATNLLRHCAEARAGERLLVITEPPEHGYYSEDAVACIESAAQEMGLFMRRMDVGFSPSAPRLTPDRLAEIDRADVIVFLARLGDQLRFAEMPAGKRIVVSFALDADAFGSPFGTVPYPAMEGLHRCVTTALHRARSLRVRCPRGTDFSGAPALRPGPGDDTTIRRFPLSVFPPIPASDFSGRVALCGFLTGTGSLYYDDYTLEFDGPLHAVFEHGRLIAFEGDPASVRAAEAQYDRVAARFGIDRAAVHSWHAGIHPGCGYPTAARTNYERWGGSAFGNPRILHLHTCGAYAPGEISWNVLDPTIEIDGTPVWEDGVFHAERLPGGAEILAAFPEAAAIFAEPDRRVGL
ncbi:MAG: hypothetical protein AAGB05_08340 [Pseudomonadota bacterium]